MNDTNSNKENMQKVQELMKNADKVRLGENLNEGIPLSYTSTTGKQYEGIIVFKRPSISDYMKMGALKSEILREAGVRDIMLVDGTIKMLAQIVSIIKVLAVKRPEWLIKVEAIEDIDLLYYINAQYEIWEATFRKTDNTAAAGDSESSKREKAVEA